MISYDLSLPSMIHHASFQLGREANIICTGSFEIDTLQLREEMKSSQREFLRAMQWQDYFLNFLHCVIKSMSYGAIFPVGTQYWKKKHRINLTA